MESVYHTTVNLRKAFDTLEKLVKEIVTTESFGRRILITADHGATAQSSLDKTSKEKYDYSQSDHEGRCCKSSI